MTPASRPCARGAVAAAVSLALRVALAVWASRRFPAVEDGFYYDTLARRIAHGEGYTWLWPDGAVTYAAHYPVGYPALLGGLYAVFGASPLVAMIANAVLGAFATFAIYVLARRATTEARATTAAFVFALHPALLAYVPALMTEGVTACLLTIAAALASSARESRRPWAWAVAAGLVMGMATLVRPQSLLLAPLLGALAIAGAWWRRASFAALVLATALACCLPWTARNCARMDRCALVSMNGGWNLLIGASSENGGWAKVDVPAECRDVWSESAKDLCFEAAGRRAIAGDPIRWLSKAPAKIAATFDYFGAAPWYLHSSNPEAFPGRAKVALGVVETVATRLLLIAALVACGLFPGPRGGARWVIVALGIVATCTLHAWLGYAAVVVAIAALGRAEVARAPLILPWTAGVILVTAATHAAFFGAGRYGLVVVPFVTALAFVRVRANPTPPRIVGQLEQERAGLVIDGRA